MALLTMLEIIPSTLVLEKISSYIVESLRQEDLHHQVVLEDNSLPPSQMGGFYECGTFVIIHLLK